MDVVKTYPEPERAFQTVVDADISLRLAYRRRSADPGATQVPGLVWLGGFKSDMGSSKAVRLDQWAASHGRAMLRFDYSGHGASEGAFEAGTIGQWARESLAMIQALTAGPQVLVGSSMGGWVALLVARELARLGEAHRLAGFVLIAPAVDFTEALIWAQLPPQVRRQIETEGQWLRPSPYATESYPITHALIEDGRRNLLLGSDIRTYAPVHILQGMQDPDVPWQHAMKLVEHLAQDPCTITLIRDGNHRLSRDEDLDRLVQAVDHIA